MVSRIHGSFVARYRFVFDDNQRRSVRRFPDKHDPSIPGAVLSGSCCAERRCAGYTTTHYFGGSDLHCLWGGVTAALNATV